MSENGHACTEISQNFSKAPLLNHCHQSTTFKVQGFYTLFFYEVKVSGVLITNASRRNMDYKIKKKDFTHFKTNKSLELYKRCTSTRNQKHKKDKDH